MRLAYSPNERTLKKYGHAGSAHHFYSGSSSAGYSFDVDFQPGNFWHGDEIVVKARIFGNIPRKEVKERVKSALLQDKLIDRSAEPHWFF
jgi:hypothetical protein